MPRIATLVRVRKNSRTRPQVARKATRKKSLDIRFGLSFGLDADGDEPASSGQVKDYKAAVITGVYGALKVGPMTADLRRG